MPNVSMQIPPRPESEPDEEYDPLTRPQVIPQERPGDWQEGDNEEQYPDDKDMPLPND
uniref:Uncharacterized protein n=1 Tax=Pseudomonas wadenswilerensis TaxID=1785161 RepID=A0A380T1U1_9PSED|nr:conserved protein of unknown function [Pseudomonas sp. JV241A]SUQ63481.1 hypothetical protein CCOS864_02932 [Pseudomonas wadenswilerensis]